MKPINNIMVCIDLSDTDDRIVEHAIYWAKLFPECKKIILFHNIRKEFLNDTLLLSEKSIDKLITNIFASTKKRFESVLEQSSLAFDIVVTFESNSAKAIMNVSKKYEVSLLLLGKKRPGRGTGIIAQSVLSTDGSNLPVLLIPYGKSPQLKALVCSAELSINEKPMFEFADKINQLANTSKICLHVYRLPMAYFPYIDQNNASLQEGAKKRAQDRFKVFKKQISLNADSWNLDLLQGVNIAETVASYCKEQGTDLIVIMRSAKTITSTKLGSNAKKMMRTSSGIPLLII